MYRKIIMITVALLLATPLFAQFDFPSMGGASSAMGGASVALPDDESALINVAGLAWVDKGLVALAVRQNFLAEGLGYAATGFAMPLPFGTAALSGVHYGNSDYHEQRATLSYAVPLSDDIALGAAFHYLHSGTSDPYYSPLNRVTFTVAMQYRYSDDLSVGFKAYNPVAVVADGDDLLRVPAVFNLGVAYKLTPELLTVVEAEKTLYRLPTLKIGLSYSFYEYYAFRVGVNTQPIIYTFGFGMKREHFGADMAVQIHNILGVTPQLSLHYSF